MGSTDFKCRGRVPQLPPLATTLCISHSHFNVGNVSLFVCLHDWAVACASCATKQTFARCRLFLEGTLQATSLICAIPEGCMITLIDKCLYALLAILSYHGGSGGEDFIVVEKISQRMFLLHHFNASTFKKTEAFSSYFLLFTSIPFKISAKCNRPDHTLQTKKSYVYSNVDIAHAWVRCRWKNELWLRRLIVSESRSCFRVVQLA